jgi:hypothetical protein
MSLETIYIHRTLPIINGFVAVPRDTRNQVTRAAALNAVSGSTSYRIRNANDPWVLELPRQNVQENISDYHQTLRET